MGTVTELFLGLVNNRTTYRVYDGHIKTQEHQS